MGSKFSILLSSRAHKDIRKLKLANQWILNKIMLVVDSLCINPYKGKSLKGTKKGCYSLREGDYRIIYEIYTEKGLVHIIRVGHRKDVYR